MSWTKKVERKQVGRKQVGRKLGARNNILTLRQYSMLYWLYGNICCVGYTYSEIQFDPRIILNNAQFPASAYVTSSGQSVKKSTHFDHPISYILNLDSNFEYFFKNFIFFQKTFFFYVVLYLERGSSNPTPTPPCPAPTRCVQRQTSLPPTPRVREQPDTPTGGA